MRSARLPRRFLLWLFLLPLAAPSFGQIFSFQNQLLASNGELYASYTDSQVCLERSDGTLLWIELNSTNSWQAVDMPFAGAPTIIATFPDKSYLMPSCPAIANDGNYYGASPAGGDYDHGYIYQLTSAGKLNILYSFTGGPDGSGPAVPPVQASDGNLYWLAGQLLLRYSASTGLTAITLDYYSDSPGPLLEASDGNFYAYANGDVVQLTPKGAVTVIYTPPVEDYGAETGSVDTLYLTGNVSYPLAALTEYDYANDDQEFGCSADGNYYWTTPLQLSGTPASAPLFSIGMDEYNGGDVFAPADADYYDLNLALGGNGTFYAALSDYNSYDSQNEEGGNSCFNQTSDSIPTFPAPAYAPITMSLGTTHVKPGGSTTLTWRVNNAYSDTLQQCFGFGGLSGKVALAGTATVSAPSAGKYVSSIVCGGTETGIATLVAGNTILSLSSSAKQVNQGSPVTLTATVTNAGTPAATGKVNFLLGSTVVGSATLANNVATLKASTGVPPGTYNIVASYAGDASYGAATSPSVAITVLSKAPTSTTLTPAGQSVVQGANISITATVAGNSTHGAPTGSVKFLVGTTAVGTVALSANNSTSSQAKLTSSTATISPGTYSVTASYGGDSGNLASNSNTVAVTVNPTTPVTLTISPNPAPADASFTLTATIKGKDSPSGTVFFYINGTQDLTSGNVSGGVAQVTLPAGTLASGTYQVTATYAGDSNNPTGTSPAVTLTVQ